MTLHHAYLIKGWLLDKDPPKQVIEALEAIIASKHPSESVTHSGNPFGVTIVPLARKPEPIPLEDAESTSVTEQPKPHRKHNWSPERRAAAAERMRIRQANGSLRKKQVSPPGEAYAPLPAEAVGAARQTW